MTNLNNELNRRLKKMKDTDADLIKKLIHSVEEGKNKEDIASTFRTGVRNIVDQEVKK